MTAELVASFFTLSGSGFGVPARHPFPERCSAAAQAGFAGIGLHVDDVERNVASGTGVETMREVLDGAALRVVEIEFLSGWAVDPDREALSRTEANVYAVADAFGGRHVSAGELTPSEGDLDVEPADRHPAQVCGRAADHGLCRAAQRRTAGARRLPAECPRHAPAARRRRPRRGGPRRQTRRAGIHRAVLRRSNYPEFRELAAAEAARRAADKAHAVLRKAGV